MLTALLLSAQETGTEEPEPTGDIDETTLTFDLDTQDQEPQALDVEIPTLGFGDFLRMFLFLGLVIAVIYLFFWMLRRISGKGASADQEIIKLLATQQLRNDHTIYLVEVGNQMLLLGGGSNQLSLITEITDKETVDELKLKSSQGEKGQGYSFQNLLGGAFSGKNSLNLGFMNKQKDRLKKL